MKKLALTILLVFLHSFEASAQDRTKLIYYQKPDDPTSLLQDIQRWSDANRTSLVRARPNPNYSGRKIVSNAVLCGELANSNLAISLLGELIGSGMEILYFGKFYNPEINSRRNTIDVRTIGGEDYPERKSALKVTDFSNFTQQELCGFGGGLSLERIILENPEKRYRISRLESREYAESLGKLYTNRGRKFEVDEKDGEFSLTIQRQISN